jgi:hypothetical protein
MRGRKASVPPPARSGKRDIFDHSITVNKVSNLHDASKGGKELPALTGHRRARSNVRSGMDAYLLHVRSDPKTVSKADAVKLI